MISPKDIETKEFGRSKMGGYKPEEVDAFLDEILSDYVVLLEEKELLTKKVATLTDKIEAYREDQDKQKYSAINNQRTYDDIIVTAKKKADKLVYEAQDYAKKLIEAAKVEAERQQQVKSQLTAEVEDFKSKLLSIYENHVKLISSIPVIKKDDEFQNSATLEMLKVATADVPDVKREYDFEAEAEAEADALVAELEDRSTTIVMPKISENKASFSEPAKEEVRRYSRARFVETVEDEIEEDEDTYLEDEYKKASKRLVSTKDIEEEDEEKSEKVKGLFDSKPKRGLFGSKKVKVEKKKKYDDDDDDDDLDFDEDDDFYDDDDE